MQKVKLIKYDPIGRHSYIAELQYIETYADGVELRIPIMAQPCPCGQCNGIAVGVPSAYKSILDGDRFDFIDKQVGQLIHRVQKQRKYHT